MKLPVKYNRVFDKDDNIVEIEKVNADNRQPEYYSIGTHTPMVAAIGETNQHYFRAKRGYKINPETELLKYTKNILYLWIYETLGGLCSFVEWKRFLS